MFCFIASGVSAGAGQSRRVFPCVLKANVAGTRINLASSAAINNVGIAADANAVKINLFLITNLIF